MSGTAIPKQTAQDLSKTKQSWHPVALKEEKRQFYPGCMLAIHIYMTISFLLKGEDPPFRIPCSELLSLEHLLLHCSDLTEIREKHFHANSLRILFRDVSLGSIYDFLKEISVFNKL